MRRFVYGLAVGMLLTTVAAVVFWPIPWFGSPAPPARSDDGAGRTEPVPPPAAPGATDKSGEWRRIHDEMAKAKAAGTAEGLERAKKAAREMLDVEDPDDAEAHAILGDVEFRHPIPEAIVYLGHPFIRVVEEANARRWFSDLKEYERAAKAWERTVAHAHRLETDRTLRCLEGARANMEHDEAFGRYVYAARYASPFLVCFTDGERIDEDALAKMSPEDRSKQYDAWDAKRASWRKRLAEKGRILQQTYAEFLKRYGEACDLKDLAGEYGGRPDYGIGKRSYRDGCPLVMWIFSDSAAFREYHTKIKREGLLEGVGGYFSPRSGWVYSYEEDGGDRELEIGKTVRDVTHQLLHWFTAQKNDWQTQARMPPSWFGHGLSQWMAGVTMDPDRHLTFHGLNRPVLEWSVMMKKQFSAENKLYPIFPLADFVALQGYDDVADDAAERWRIDYGLALKLFDRQAWALTYFLNEYDGHRYRERYLKLMDEALHLHRTAKEFKAAFGIATDSDWAALQKEFDTFYRHSLLEMNLRDIGKTPPALDDWPTYVPDDD